MGVLYRTNAAWSKNLLRFWKILHHFVRVLIRNLCIQKRSIFLKILRIWKTFPITKLTFLSTLATQAVFIVLQLIRCFWSPVGNRGWLWNKFSIAVCIWNFFVWASGVFFWGLAGCLKLSKKQYPLAHVWRSVCLKRPLIPQILYFHVLMIGDKEFNVWFVGT